MTQPYLADPSPARIVEIIRQKVGQNHVVLYPGVGEEIQRLKGAKKLNALTHEGEQHKTIIDVDIKNALATGVATKVEALPDEPGWWVIVQGLDRDGDKLCVEVRVFRDATDPLLIMNFFPPDEQ